MAMASNKPTEKTYGQLQYAYDYFNKKLFNARLPEVVFTYHRQNRVMGYASFQRWEQGNNTYVDEIAINPEYFTKYPLIEICQTLVHEMTHIWQGHFGKPGRRGYHNQQWANKMQEIGLMPSSTGKPGGAVTGEAMMDYVLLDGPFMRACKALIKQGFSFPLLDRFPVFRVDAPITVYDEKDNPVTLDQRYQLKDAPSAPMSAYKDDLSVIAVQPHDADETNMLAIHSEQISSTAPVKVSTTRPKRHSGRVKYMCKGCSCLFWAKPGLNVGCLDCNLKFQEED